MDLIYVDNKTGAIKKFEDMVGQIPEIETLHSFTSSEEALDFLRNMPKKCRVYFQTMPHFELFVDGKLVPITQKKVKELLAILVDYAGSSVTSEQAINYMWENRLVDDKSKALLRVTASRLRDLLAQEKIEDILIEENGVRALDRKKVDCDYYQILDGNPEAMKRYHGEYMVEYSWAEDTNAKLARITGKEMSETT